MANETHLKILSHGAEIWNDWREQVDKAIAKGEKHPLPDLSKAWLYGANLSHVNLASVDLRKAILTKANLNLADLTEVDLKHAELTGADLQSVRMPYADLKRAKLKGAFLYDADLSYSNLSEADLSNCNLVYANLRNAHFKNTDLTNATIGLTTFAASDMSTVKGLDTIVHEMPSTLGIDVLYMSDGKVPKTFLRGIGIPEDFLIFLPSLVGRAIEFYSCFISYSNEDERFAQHLHSALRRYGLRVWYAPEEIKAGRKIHEEIFRAIQVHDKLLLVLSENSMKSEWVATEIKRAKKVEREENRRKLFPIRLVDFNTIQKWECFDADSGKDLAVELREYYIPDFSKWKTHGAFKSGVLEIIGISESQRTDAKKPMSPWTIRATISGRSRTLTTREL